MRSVSVYEYPDVAAYLGRHEPKKACISLNYADIVRYFWALDGSNGADNKIWESISDITSVLAAIKGRDGQYQKNKSFEKANSERKAVYSEKVGILAAKAISKKIYKIPHLFVLDDDNIEYVSSSRNRPDFFGVNKRNKGFLFEAKGTGDVRVKSQVITKAKTQLTDVECVIYRDECYDSLERYISAASFTHLSTLKFDSIDPVVAPVYEADPDESGLQIKLKEEMVLLRRYYEPISSLIAYHSKVLKMVYPVRKIRNATYLVVKVEENIFIGMNAGIYACLGDYLDAQIEDMGKRISTIIEKQEAFSLDEEDELISVGLDGIICICQGV